MRGERAPTFQGWHPALRDASQDVKQAWRLGTARAIDSIQNSGWLTGAVETSAAGVCGDGLKLNAKPDPICFGGDQQTANEWARMAERLFESWANNPRACDALGRATLGQLGVMAYRHWLATGEIVATLPYFSRAGTMWESKVKLLPAWRLSDRSDEMTGLCQGVRLDAVGAPKSYLFKIKTPVYGEQEVELIAADAVGRPLVAHLFDGEPDQVRGITPFISILKVLRQFDQLADATLTAAIIQAIFAAVFRSAAKPEEVMQTLQSSGEQAQSDFAKLLTEKAGWYDKADISLGTNGKIAHLFPGDELEFLRSEHPNSTYEAFTKVLMREMSRPCAISYAEFSGDSSGETYSSIRMTTANNWPKIVYRRKHLPGRLHQMAYEAWAEEAIEKEILSFPGGVQAFLAQKDAACRADWRGPPKPQADDAKAAAAHETWSQLGVLPDEVICADLGLDVDDVYEQRAREMGRRKELGLPEPSSSGSAAAVVASERSQPTKPASSPNG